MHTYHRAVPTPAALKTHVIGARNLELIYEGFAAIRSSDLPLPLNMHELLAFARGAGHLKRTRWEPKTIHSAVSEAHDVGYGFIDNGPKASPIVQLQQQVEGYAASNPFSEHTLDERLSSVSAAHAARLIERLQEPQILFIPAYLPDNRRPRDPTRQQHVMTFLQSRSGQYEQYARKVLEILARYPSTCTGPESWSRTSLSSRHEPARPPGQLSLFDT